MDSNELITQKEGKRIEDEIENSESDEPKIFKLYFNFLTSSYGKYIILLFWFGILLLGGFWGRNLLSQTNFVFTAPSGTDGNKADNKLKHSFPLIANSEELIAYYYCDKCNNSLKIIDPSLNMTFMSYDLNISLFEYNIKHKNSIIDYNDYYISLDNLNKYNLSTSEYIKVDLMLENTFIQTSTYKSALGLIRYDSNKGSNKVKHMVDHITSQCKKITKKYDNNIVLKITGQQPMVEDMSEESRSDVENKDIITIPLALCVLATVVHSWRVMFVPIICVFTSICTSFSIMLPVAQYIMDVNPFAPSIMMSVTVAMSIDYSLFLLTRFYEEMHRKRDDIDNRREIIISSIRQMTRWSGKVVALSGCILSLTYLALVFYPMEMLQSVGLGASIAVACTIVVNLTLTPALLLTFPNYFSVFGFGCFENLYYRLRGINRPYKFSLHDNDNNDYLFPKSINDDSDEDDSGDDLRIIGNSNSNSINNNNSSNPKNDLNKTVNRKIYPFDLTAEEEESFCSRCWYHCGSYTTLFPYSLVVIVVVYSLISPVGWRILELKKQLEDTLIFPRDSDYLKTYKRVKSDFSGGTLAPWYIEIPYVNYNKSNNRTVYSYEYILDSGYMMSLLWNRSQLLYNYNFTSLNGLSCTNGEYYENESIYKESIYSPLVFDSTLHYVSPDNSTTYFELITSFDPYYSGAIKFVKKLRNELKFICNKRSISKVSYKCYLSGGSIDEVDSVNTIFKSFPLVLMAIIVVVFGMMGFFFKSVFVPIRLFLTITLPMTLVYGISILVYQKGLLSSWHWSAIQDTDGLYWIAPVMTVTILIGLALDYDVFLFARIYEYRMYGVPTREAIIRGVYQTGSVITAAGVIMAIAFCGLLLSQMTTLNQVGFILVVAVLVDTFVIRTSLVPAVLSMAKEVNWWPGIKQNKYNEIDDSIVLESRINYNTTLDERM